MGCGMNNALAALLASTAASARCEVDLPPATLPRDGAVDVPTNVVLVMESWDVSDWDLDRDLGFEFHLYRLGDQEEIPVEEEVVSLTETHMVRRFTPTAALEPGTDYLWMDDRAGGGLFTTGDGPDGDPPGEESILDVHTRRGGGCRQCPKEMLELQLCEEDTSETEPLLYEVEAIPANGDQTLSYAFASCEFTFIGQYESFATHWNVADLPALTLRLRVHDLAGNTSDWTEYGTARFGCDHVGGAVLSWGSLLLFALARRRMSIEA